MRTPALTALVASGALVVTVSAVIAAFAVGDDPGSTRGSTPPASAAPAVSVTPSVTQMTMPSAAPTTAAPVFPPTAPPPTTAAPTTAPSATAPATPRTVRYVVKGGDTLSDIAYWFQLNGFGSLYAANRDVIGADPDRIRPGQVYTISNGRLRMS